MIDAKHGVADRAFVLERAACGAACFENVASYRVDEDVDVGDVALCGEDDGDVIPFGNVCPVESRFEELGNEFGIAQVLVHDEVKLCFAETLVCEEDTEEAASFQGERHVDTVVEFAVADDDFVAANELAFHVADEASFPRLLLDLFPDGREMIACRRLEDAVVCGLEVTVAFRVTAEVAVHESELRLQEGVELCRCVAPVDVQVKDAG